MLERPHSPPEDLQELCPRARVDEVLVTVLDEEVLVYDLTRHKAHALNPPAGLVWQRCDGQTTVRELAALRVTPDRPPLGQAVVWLALRQLAEAHLLDAVTPLPGHAPKYTRLQLLRAGLVSSAVGLPVVATILAPTPAHAQSCGGLGEPCCLLGGCTCAGCTCQGGICLDP
ncbi:MAG TPA: PqqD family protein [Chloroflexota bacterium]|nr:PqqD family protein [Chloroflexota bacterium]